MLPAGYRLICHGKLDSTNDEAKRLARDGATEGSLIWALEQTAGRGRRGRPWISPPGNLYVSLILRPDCPPSRAAQVGFVAALAVGGALAAVIPDLVGLSYKWPNDVLINGRKFAGVLLESEMTSPEKLSFLVVGVGVNLRHSPKGAEFPATSVQEQGLGMVAPEALLEAFVRSFHAWKARWDTEGFAPVRAAWLAAAAIARGADIRVRLEAAELQGRFFDIDAQGALVLDAEGGCRRISAGEIFPAQR
jgi:BirA family biotin operon repressor/biotin-[acetyl-CoA-carboxylase] ligase